MTTQPDPADSKKARVRSPAYPFISLPKAIDYARKFWDKEKKNFAPVAVAYGDFGFAVAAGGQVVSALIQFGLMESSGEKENRKVKLTDHAVRILGSTDQKSEAFLKMIKESALRPKLYASLMSKYASELPSDGVLCHELEYERDFNKTVVPEVVRAFRETVSFAKLDEPDTLQTSEADLDDRGDMAPDIAEEQAAVLPLKEKPMQQAQQQQGQPQQKQQPPPAGSVLRTFTTGTDTMDAEIRITSHAGDITGDDIAFLKDYLSFLEKGWSRRKPPVAASAASVPTISTLPPRPAPLPPSMSASVQLMITKQMESDLIAAGYSQEEINAMTPQEAQDNIRKAQP